MIVLKGAVGKPLGLLLTYHLSHEAGSERSSKNPLSSNVSFVKIISILLKYNLQLMMYDAIIGLDA